MFSKIFLVFFLSYKKQKVYTFVLIVKVIYPTKNNSYGLDNRYLLA
ncbi:hypothetical protein ABH902_001144 [Enterococcus sp. UD-01]|jgi:hypothetical protein